MAKEWMRVLVVGLLLAGGATGARGQAPGTGGGGVFAEDPVPPTPPDFCPDTSNVPPPTATPFPHTTNDFANGFDEHCPGPSQLIWFGGAGTVGLVRQRLGNGVVAVVDPGINVPNIPRNVDSGIKPPQGAPTALTFSNTPTDFHWGVEATVGVQYGYDTIELSGFYIGPQSNGRSYVAPGLFDLPFSAFRPPLGFEGDNFMWLQADKVGLFLENRFASVELNYRRQCQPWLEFLVGARYVYHSERFGIFTDDALIESPPPVPADQATYLVHTISRIYGGQVGFEIQQFLLPKFFLTFSDKNMLGYNVYQVDNKLVRGDGFTRPEGFIRGNEMSGLVELELMATWEINEHMRLRAGYQALWLIHLPEAHQNVRFDPTTPISGANDRGSIFYHGPRLEFQLAF